jgi:N utilization substance protein A
LSPAKVKEVRIHEDTGVAEVIVPDYQLSLAIWKEGQNARLAARLTGWRVDIKSESQLADEEAGIFPVEEEEVEYAEGEWVRNEATGELEWHSADGEVVTAGEWAVDQQAAAEAEAAERGDEALTGADAAAPEGGTANLEESSGNG